MWWCWWSWSLSKPGLPFAMQWLDHRQSWSLSKPGLPFGISAELDSMQAGFADCDTVVACCVDTVAVIEGLCGVDRASGRYDTVGWGGVWTRRRC